MSSDQIAGLSFRESPVQNDAMTDLLERAVATARGLAPEIQDEIARVVLALARDDAGIYELTAEEAAEQDAADAEEARGEYATQEEVRAIWAKHGL